MTIRTVQDIPGCVKEVVEIFYAGNQQEARIILNNLRRQRQDLSELLDITSSLLDNPPATSEDVYDSIVSALGAIDSFEGGDIFSSDAGEENFFIDDFLNVEDEEPPLPPYLTQPPPGITRGGAQMNTKGPSVSSLSVRDREIEERHKALSRSRDLNLGEAIDLDIDLEPGYEIDIFNADEKASKKSYSGVFSAVKKGLPPTATPTTPPEAIADVLSMSSLGPIMSQVGRRQAEEPGAGKKTPMGFAPVPTAANNTFQAMETPVPVNFVPEQMSNFSESTDTPSDFFSSPSLQSGMFRPPSGSFDAFRPATSQSGVLRPPTTQSGVHRHPTAQPATQSGAHHRPTAQPAMQSGMYHHPTAQPNDSGFPSTQSGILRPPTTQSGILRPPTEPQDLARTPTGLRPVQQDSFNTPLPKKAFANLQPIQDTSRPGRTSSASNPSVSGIKKNKISASTFSFESISEQSHTAAGSSYRQTSGMDPGMSSFNARSGLSGLNTRSDTSGGLSSLNARSDFSGRSGGLSGLNARSNIGNRSGGLSGLNARSDMGAGLSTFGHPRGAAAQRLIADSDAATTSFPGMSRNSSSGSVTNSLTPSPSFRPTLSRIQAIRSDTERPTSVGLEPIPVPQSSSSPGRYHAMHDGLARAPQQSRGSSGAPSLEPMTRMIRLCIPLSELPNRTDINAKAGFILSMVDGTMSIADIISLCSWPQEETQILLCNLKARNIIDFF